MEVKNITKVNKNDKNQAINCTVELIKITYELFTCFNQFNGFICSLTEIQFSICLLNYCCYIECVLYK